MQQAAWKDLADGLAPDIFSLAQCYIRRIESIEYYRPALQKPNHNL